MDNQLVLKPYPVISYNFIKAYIITMRPYLLFVSGITGIVGMSFIPGITLTQTILIFLASFLSYGFGQALTDCFQIDTDSLSSPYRPLTQGVISKSQVLIISIFGLIFSISIFGFYNPTNLIFGLIGGIGLYTYTYFKKKWWAGPFYNAWIVTLLCLMAYNCGDLSEQNINNSILIFMFITVFFGYSNFVLTGYFKDIFADSATGYKTLPVVYGRVAACLISDIFAIFTIVPASLIALKYLQLDNIYTTIIVFSLLLSGLLLLIIAQYRLHKVKTDEEAHFAISPVVHSYILILSSVAITQKEEWVVPLLLFYTGFLFVMKLRPAKNQI